MTNDPSRTVEIIGFRNDAFHEPMPGHELYFVTKCDFRNVYI